MGREKEKRGVSSCHHSPMIASLARDLLFRREKASLRAIPKPFPLHPTAPRAHRFVFARFCLAFGLFFFFSGFAAPRFFVSCVNFELLSRCFRETPWEERAAPRGAARSSQAATERQCGCYTIRGGKTGHGRAVGGGRKGRRRKENGHDKGMGSGKRRGGGREGRKGEKSSEGNGAWLENGAQLKCG